MALRKKRAAKRVKIMKGKSLPRGEESKLRKKPGASNLGKYKGVKRKDFCGSTPGTFPVNSAKRCRAALAYAHNDASPGKVRSCVKRKCKGKIKEFSKK